MQGEQDVCHLFHFHNTVIGLSRVDVNGWYLGLGPPGKRVILSRRFKGVFRAAESRDHGGTIGGIYCHGLTAGGVTGRENDPHAINDFLVALHHFDFLSLIQLKLHTGRTHQIRVHMKHIGHPVFGDPDYGGREERIGTIQPEFREEAGALLELIDRQALHASTLEFKHPITETELIFTADLPPDMQNILDKIDNI